MTVFAVSMSWAKTERSERIPPFVDTERIEVSITTNSSGGAYYIVHYSGKLSFMSYHSQTVSMPPGSYVTTDKVVEFREIYDQISQAVVMENNFESYEVYFWRRGEGSATAVFIPAQHAALVKKLSDIYAHAKQSGKILPLKD